MRAGDQLRKSHKSRLNGAAFNQDGQCFAVADDQGFRVYNSDPMEMWVSREFSEGGLAIASMLYRTNYLALVGGGSRPRYPQNKIILWDDSKNKAATSFEFVLPVLNVLLSRKVMVAVLINKIHVYSFATPPVLLKSFDTAPNPEGVACMGGEWLAFPGMSSGRIEIVQLVTTPDSTEAPAGHDAVDISKAPATKVSVASIIRAHKAPLQTMAIKNNYLASASTTGTIIRVFSLQTFTLVHEFRRGLDKAAIWSLQFSPSGDQLAALSDKSTLHVYQLTPNSINRQHSLAALPLAPKYFRNQWSFASCQTDGHGPGVLGWTGEHSVIILWKETGRWEKYTLLRDAENDASSNSSKINVELVREAKRSIV